MHSNRRSYHSDVLPSSSTLPEHLPHNSRPPDRGSVANAVTEDIMKKMKQRDKSKLKFVCDADLQRIMDLHANQLFAFEHWHNEQADLVLEKCYLVLGILVFIGAFTHLPSLRDIFFQKGERKLSPTALTNDKLWLKDDSQLSFLDTAQLRYAFLDLQWIIKPYTFYEEKPSRRLDVPSNARLPFTHAFREVGTGAFGRVSAVVVGGRHYINSSGQRYENPMDCALKQLKTSKDLLRELKQLEIIKESLVKHERVLMHYVSFVHGDTFNILLPLAKLGNLEHLLHEGYDPNAPAAAPLYAFTQRFPAFDWRKRKCIQDLLAQITNIVDAVKWLHSGDVLKLEIIHRDLKPDNILIAEDPTTDPAKKSSIGLWQLSDLGISVLQPSAPDSPDAVRADAVDPNKTVTIGDFVSLIENRTTLSNRTATGARTNRTSRTYFRRPPGTYTAPEVERNAITKESDVWSLACIFAEVIAFALGGRNLVREFEDTRVKGKMDNFFYNPMMPLGLLVVPSENVEYMVRPAVSTWLNELADEHGEWVKCCVKIILRTLVVEVDQRPKASELHQMLLHATDHQNRVPSHSGSKCPHLKPHFTPVSSPPAQVSPTSPTPQWQSTFPPQSQERPQPRKPPPSQPPPQSQPNFHQHRYSEPEVHPPPDPKLQPLSRPRTQPISPPLGKERRQSSGTSGNRSDVPSSTQSLQLSLEFSNEEQPKIAYFQRKRAKGKPTSATDLSICPTGEYAIWLFKTSNKPVEFELDLTSLDPSLDEPRRGSALDPQQSITLDNTIALSEGVDWVRVEYAYGFAIIQGKSLKKTESTKYFRFFDLSYHPPRPIHTSAHAEMARVGLGNMATSSSGFAVLRANSKLLLFDLSVDKSIPEVLEPAERKYRFSTTSFSPSGDRLIAWCFGEKLNDSLHMWYIDPESRKVSPTFRYDIMTHMGCQAPVQWVLPSPEQYVDGSIDCVVREGQDHHGKFFVVRLGLEPETGQQLPREYLTEAANGALVATVYKGTHLITLVGNTGSKNGQVMSYPMRVSRQSRGKIGPARLGPFLMPPNRKMRIITRPFGLSVVTLSNDRQYSRTWFRES